MPPLTEVTPSGEGALQLVSRPVGFVPPKVGPTKPACADDDIALVHASQAGDDRAFEELVRRHERRLLRIALNVTHNQDDAEEAVQEAFLKAFRSLSRFQETAKFSTWLVRIVLNESILKLRSRSRGQSISLDGDLHAGGDNQPMEIADWSANPEEEYNSSELREILRTSLQCLTPALRVVFQLRDVERLSIEETSEALGISATAVKARLFRARLQLRERLNRHFGKRP